VYPTCLDLSENGEFLAVGASDAHVLTYSLKTNKKITKTKEHPTAIVTIKIWKERPLGLVTCDAEGSTQKVVFEHTLGMNRTESYWIFRKTMVITNVLFLNRDVKEYICYNESGDEEYVAAIAGIDQVLIAIIDPVVRVIYKSKRPPNTNIKSMPHISWIKGVFNSKRKKVNTYLLIAWDHIVYLLELNNINGSVFFVPAAYFPLEEGVSI